MTVNEVMVRKLSALPLILLAATVTSAEQPGNPQLWLVKQALAAELRNATDAQHPMRYRLHKVSPRFSTTKEIAETKVGAVALLIATNDLPLSEADEQKEQARLDALLADPSRQRHRKQSEDADTARALKVLRALPDAFVYQYEGSGFGPTGRIEKYSFRPNPGFDPPDLETTALAAMTGELWIDPAAERVTRLEGHLQRDVDFGWGVLGRLYKGGWIVIEQADVGEHQWRIVRFQMVMNGRVIFKTRNFDTLEEESNFAPLPVGLSYAQAIQLLRNGPERTAHTGR